MYVYSCKSGQMYRVNLLFKLWLPAAWKVHGGPCASVHLAKCLKSNQMFIPTWQYSISGYDFCGLSFVKECALNPRVLKFFKSSQPLFNIRVHTTTFMNFLIPLETYCYTRSIPVYWNTGTLPFMVWILGFTQPILMWSTQ